MAESSRNNIYIYLLAVFEMQKLNYIEAWLNGVRDATDMVIVNKQCEKGEFFKDYVMESR